ncbi:hypothetical protein GO986_12695 [Deinococcus sp. HMF7620]|uniref:Uncharacterized protein n=1 Tax=Deinococcus arboris TaxID=2682977 RepID=A0A7C9M749_9DEIO|nr:hypothetical protein [Deinococcus arboris]MVN87625.1 hypothetical protein [Deinococcus arboris]
MDEILHAFPLDRKFQVWWYRVSHGQLLLRSGRWIKGTDNHERTDVWFMSVGAMVLLDTNFRGGLTITRIHDAEGAAQQAGVNPKLLRHLHLFALDAAEGCSLVVAGRVYVAEDVGPLFGRTSWELEAEERWAQQIKDQTELNLPESTEAEG